MIKASLLEGGGTTIVVTEGMSAHMTPSVSLTADSSLGEGAFTLSNREKNRYPDG